MQDPKRAAGRLPGHKVVAGLVSLVLLVFAAAVALFFAGREPRGPILALGAMPGGDAMVLRRGFESRKAVHIVRYDRTGRLVWSEALFGAQEDGVPFVVGDRVVVPAREARGHPTTHVFQASDGAFLFRGDPSPASVSPDATARYATGAGRLYELFPGEPGRLAAYDLGTGARDYAVDVPRGATELAFTEASGGVLVVDGAERLAFVAATGAPAPAGSVEPLPRVSRPEVVLDAEGCMSVRYPSGTTEVAQVRAEDGIAPPRPEHATDRVLYLHTARDLVGLALPGLDPPPGYDGPIEVAPARGPCSPMASATTR